MTRGDSVIIKRSEYDNCSLIFEVGDVKSHATQTLSVQRNNSLDSGHNYLWFQATSANTSIDLVVSMEDAESLALAIQALLQEYKTRKRIEYDED